MKFACKLNTCTTILNQYYWVQKTTYLITFRFGIFILTITAGFSFITFGISHSRFAQRLGVLLLGLGVLLEIAKVVEVMIILRTAMVKVWRSECLLTDLLSGLTRRSPSGLHPAKSFSLSSFTQPCPIIYNLPQNFMAFLIMVRVQMLPPDGLQHALHLGPQGCSSEADRRFFNSWPPSQDLHLPPNC